MLSLQKLNIYASVAHLTSAIVLIILYNIYKASHSLSKLTVFQYHIAGENTDNMCTTSGSNKIPSKCTVDLNYQQPRSLFKFNVIYGAIAFFFITAFAHLFYATDGFGTGSYTSQIKQGWNSYRWYEYAASASLMSILLGLTEGVRDVSTLALLAVVTAAMQFNGYATESLLRGKETLGPKLKSSIVASQISAWTLFVGLWVILFYNFGVVVHDVKEGYPNEPNARVPSWIWIIVISQAIYFALFGVTQARHIDKRLSGKAFDYATIERSYLLLSFSAKLSLAAGLGYGLIFRTKDC
jgi:hypothetical protein